MEFSKAASIPPSHFSIFRSDILIDPEASVQIKSYITSQPIQKSLVHIFYLSPSSTIKECPKLKKILAYTAVVRSLLSCCLPLCGSVPHTRFKRIEGIPYFIGNKETQKGLRLPFLKETACTLASNFHHLGCESLQLFHLFLD